MGPLLVEEVLGSGVAWLGAADVGERLEPVAEPAGTAACAEQALAGRRCVSGHRALLSASVPRGRWVGSAGGSGIRPCSHPEGLPLRSSCCVSDGSVRGPPGP